MRTFKAIKLFSRCRVLKAMASIRRLRDTNFIPDSDLADLADVCVPQ